jgi:hypothetical protein
MTRNGKIARLPHNLREQINLRLQDGEEAKPIADWLNTLPEVQAFLKSAFDGLPINGKNPMASNRARSPGPARQKNRGRNKKELRWPPTHQIGRHPPEVMEQVEKELRLL